MQRPYQVCPQRGHLSALPVALTGSDCRNGKLKERPSRMMRILRQQLTQCAFPSFLITYLIRIHFT